MYFYLTFQSDFQSDIGVLEDTFAEIHACSDEGDMDYWHFDYKNYETPEDMDSCKNPTPTEMNDYARFLEWKEWKEAKEKEMESKKRKSRKRKSMN